MSPGSASERARNSCAEKPGSTLGNPRLLRAPRFGRPAPPSVGASGPSAPSAGVSSTAVSCSPWGLSFCAAGSPAPGSRVAVTSSCRTPPSGKASAPPNSPPPGSSSTRSPSSCTVRPSGVRGDGPGVPSSSTSPFEISSRMISSSRSTPCSSSGRSSSKSTVMSIEKSPDSSSGRNPRASRRSNSARSSSDLRSSSATAVAISGRNSCPRACLNRSSASSYSPSSAHPIAATRRSVRFASGSAKRGLLVRRVCSSGALDDTLEHLERSLERVGARRQLVEVLRAQRFLRP